MTVESRQSVKKAGMLDQLRARRQDEHEGPAGVQPGICHPGLGLWTQRDRLGNSPAFPGAMGQGPHPLAQGREGAERLPLSAMASRRPLTR